MFTANNIADESPKKILSINNKPFQTSIIINTPMMAKMKLNMFSFGIFFSSFETYKIPNKNIPFKYNRNAATVYPEIWIFKK